MFLHSLFASWLLQWVERRQVSVQEYVPTEWVPFLGQLVIVCISRDCATTTTRVCFRIGGHQRVHIPADLLRGSLLPFTALPWDALRIDDALVHRLLLEDAVNSSWIVLHLCVSLWRFERSNLSRIAGCHVIWLLCDELDCRTKEISYHHTMKQR